MCISITAELIRTSRENAITLVHLVDHTLSSAVRIAKTVANAPDSSGLNSDQEKRRRLSLFWFVDSFIELREHLDSISEPSGELLEWFEAVHPAATLMGWPCSSRTRLAHDLAVAVINAPSNSLWPLMDCDVTSFHARYSPNKLQMPDVDKIVAMAAKITQCTEYSKKDSQMILAGIRAETAASLARLPIPQLHENHGVLETKPTKDCATDDECPVKLNGQFKPIWIDDQKIPALRTTQYSVIQTLVDAYGGGLSKNELEVQSGCADAVNVLKRIRKSRPLWEQVIRLAGKPYGKYEIVRP